MAIENGPSEINRAIRDYISNGALHDWEFKDFAADLYQTEQAFRFYFFSPRRPDDYAMPQSVIGFEKLHVNTLAAYSLVPDAVGLRFRITFNTAHLDRPLWSLYETLLHEMTHLYVENNPTLPHQIKGHGKAFTAWCEEMGLHPRIGTGVHWKAADGQFERLMTRWQVQRPKEAERQVPKETPKINWWEIGPRTKGRSTLILYTTDQCNRQPICKVRSGRLDITARCLACGGDFYPRL